jgi:hypothetical protein
LQRLAFSIIISTNTSKTPVKKEYMPVEIPLVVDNSAERAIMAAEESIAKTLRSCLGKYCYDSRPDGSAVDRIALLAPPMSGEKQLLAFLQPLVSHDKSIEIVPSTHVPPYGYGKNHGWNAIVRLYRPIPVHALALSHASDDTSELFAKQSRQLVRWHCRLNHVAAHTRTLTVHVDSLLANPALEVDRIITFIVGKKGGKYPRQRMLDDIAALIAALKAGGVVPTSTAKAPSAVLATAGAQAMQDEFTMSKGLTKWPCQRFNDPILSGLPINPKSLAANCTAPFTKCSVPYDIRGG